MPAAGLPAHVTPGAPTGLSTCSMALSFSVCVHHHSGQALGFLLQQGRSWAYRGNGGAACLRASVQQGQAQLGLEGGTGASRHTGRAQHEHLSTPQPLGLAARHLPGEQPCSAQETQAREPVHHLKGFLSFLAPPPPPSLRGWAELQLSSPHRPPTAVHSHGDQHQAIMRSAKPCSPSESPLAEPQKMLCKWTHNAPSGRLSKAPYLAISTRCQGPPSIGNVSLVRGDLESCSVLGLPSCCSSGSV